VRYLTLRNKFCSCFRLNKQFEWIPISWQQNLSRDEAAATIFERHDQQDSLASLRLAGQQHGANAASLPRVGS
jgi:hypothetical protein